MQNALCAEDQVASLIEQLRVDESSGLRRLGELLTACPNDPRLHFLKGSFQAGNGDYSAAITTIRHAVDLAPGFELARFQLGFLLFTSNEPYGAQETWGPLHGLPRDNYLRLFVDGLCHLIRDEFEQASALLGEGMEANKDNVPLNSDMRLILDQIAVRQSDASAAGEEDSELVSAAQMLLQHAALKSTRH